jgi:hypothetical protein
MHSIEDIIRQAASLPEEERIIVVDTLRQGLPSVGLPNSGPDVSNPFQGIIFLRESKNVLDDYVTKAAHLD